MFELHFDFAWDNILNPSFENHVQIPFEMYIKKQRWFGGKNRSIKNIKINDAVPLQAQNDIFQLLILEISYAEGPGEMYLLPIGFSSQRKSPQGVIAKVFFRDKEGFLYEAIFNEDFRAALLELIYEGKIISSAGSDIAAYCGKEFESFLKNKKLPSASRLAQAEQSNTSFFYDDIFFFKLYRRLQKGTNPEVELTKHLTENTDFSKLPAFAGSIEWNSANTESITIGLLQKFVHSQTDAWYYFLKTGKQFFNRAIRQSPYSQMEDLFEASFVKNIELLGKRTAQLHLALAGFSKNKEIAAQPVSQEYQDYLYESVKSLARKVFDELNFDDLPHLIKDDIAMLVAIKDKIFERIEEIKTRKFSGQLIRTHGDYHLGQVLFTGDDFIITDFEGEPARPISQRRQKHIALRDVAGMMRSFHYAAYSPILLYEFKELADVETLKFWAERLYQYLSEIFLNSYFNHVEKAEFLPEHQEEMEFLISFYMLEKAIYELDYELNDRPSWLIVPTKGIMQIISKKIEIPQFSHRRAQFPTF